MEYWYVVDDTKQHIKILAGPYQDRLDADLKCPEDASCKVRRMTEDEAELISRWV